MSIFRLGHTHFLFILYACPQDRGSISHERYLSGHLHRFSVLMCSCCYTNIDVEEMTYVFSCNYSCIDPGITH